MGSRIGVGIACRVYCTNRVKNRDDILDQELASNNRDKNVNNFSFLGGFRFSPDGKAKEKTLGNYVLPSDNV